LIVAQERPDYDHQFLPQPTRKLSRKTKKRPRQMSRRKKLVLTGAIVACFVLGLFISYYFARVVTLGYSITVTEKELAELKKENEYLASEIDRLSSLDNIERVAKNELGMIEPGKDDIIMVAVDSEQNTDQITNNDGYPGALQDTKSYLTANEGQGIYHLAVQSRDNYREQNSVSTPALALVPAPAPAPAPASAPAEIKKKNMIIQAFASLLGRNAQIQED